MKVFMIKLHKACIKYLITWRKRKMRFGRGYGNRCRCCIDSHDKQFSWPFFNRTGICVKENSCTHWAFVFLNKKATPTKTNRELWYCGWFQHVSWWRKPLFKHKFYRWFQIKPKFLSMVTNRRNDWGINTPTTTVPASQNMGLSDSVCSGHWAETSSDHLASDQICANCVSMKWLGWKR